MPALSSMNVSLTAELEGFVRDRVYSGRYASSSEVFREGLRLLQLREQEEDAALTAVKAQLRRGIEQADRGEFANPDQVFAKANSIIEKHRKSQTSKRA